MTTYCYMLVRDWETDPPTAGEVESLHSERAFATALLTELYCHYQSGHLAIAPELDTVELGELTDLLTTVRYALTPSPVESTQ